MLLVLLGDGARVTVAGGGRAEHSLAAQGCAKVNERGEDRVGETSVDIATWLHGLGLQQYEQAFRDNAIDVAVLPELTADDLRDLGVGLVGHRRKLLAAIASLRSGTAPARAAAPTNSAGERRQLTVMFCDLVGSTALSLGRDPEDLRDLIAAYHRAVAEVVERFEGFLARYMGDGILIYFGYPRASENDAERAARCALALVEAVSGLKLAEELRARIGIATGMVVVGGAAPEHDVVGETPNLAARLQSLAAPNTVLIDEATRRLIGGLFEYSELGAIEPRGFTGTVFAWQVLRPSTVASRFEALRALSPTPLVGRSEELEFLSRRWERAKKGEGQVVLLLGEPGIGKSRIAGELAQRLQGEAHCHLRYFCAPHHQDTALYPVITHLEHAAGFASDDPPAAKLEKLRQLLGQGRLGHLRRRVAAHAGQRSRNREHEAELVLLAVAGVRQALLADLLSLPRGGALPEINLTPQRKKEKILETLLGLLEDLSRKRPVLMLFEDVHWIDPTSRELLDLTIERIRRQPVLLLITFRPEFQEAWNGAAHVSALLLNRLDTSEGSVLAEAVAGKALPDEVVTHIADRTDGVPLFVEELTRAVVESGLLRDEGDRYFLDRPMPSVAIPPSLHASLLSRLDRLGPMAKEIAQIGAAIGRDFAYELLAAVAGRSESELQHALIRLVEAGLVFQRGVPPDAVFWFKHALVQDAAYSTLLRGRRQQLHSRVAGTLQGQFREIAKAQPALLAHHCTEAGLTEQAIAYWLAAGRQAWRRSVTAEAVALLRRGLALVPALPDGAGRQETELELRIALGQALTANQGWGAQELAEVHSRARELASILNRPRALLFALWGQFMNHFARADLKQARRLAEELRELGDTAGDVLMQVMGSHAVGLACFQLGEFTAGRAYLDKGLVLVNPAHLGSIGQQLRVSDARIQIRIVSSRLLACFGHLDQALFHSDAALDEARRLSHSQTLAAALAAAWITRWLVRLAPGSLLQYADELLAFATEHGLGLFRASALVCRGWCLAALGRAEEGISVLTAGLASLGELGVKIWRPCILTLLGDARRMDGQWPAALKHFAEARHLAEETEDRWCQAETARLSGDVLVAMGDRTGAEASYHETIAIAQEQSAKLWELRAAASLARLWRDRGRLAEARDLLAPVYGWFTEGFGTPDLKEAKALLDELG